MRWAYSHWFQCLCFFHRLSPRWSIWDSEDTSCFSLETPRWMYGVRKKDKWKMMPRFWCDYVNRDMGEVEGVVGEYRSRTEFGKGGCCSVFSLAQMKFEGINSLDWYLSGLLVPGTVLYAGDLVNKKAMVSFPNGACGISWTDRKKNNHNQV